MADGEEESVDLDVDHLFVGLALALHKVGTLDAVLAEEADGVVLKQNLDVLAFADTLLHDLRGAQEGLAHNEVDLLGQSAEVEGVLAGSVATTNDGHRLLAIEESVAGGAG